MKNSDAVVEFTQPSVIQVLNHIVLRHEDTIGLVAASFGVRKGTVNVAIEKTKINGQDSTSSFIATILFLAAIIECSLDFVAITKSSYILSTLATVFCHFSK